MKTFLDHIFSPDSVCFVGTAFAADIHTAFPHFWNWVKRVVNEGTRHATDLYATDTLAAIAFISNLLPHSGQQRGRVIGTRSHLRRFCAGSNNSALVAHLYLAIRWTFLDPKVQLFARSGSRTSCSGLEILWDGHSCRVISRPV